jgi:DNA primase
VRFTKTDLDKLKSSLDLVELAREYTQLRRVGPTTYVGHCPHPNHNDSDASFTVDAKNQTWCCYGCHSDKKNKKEGNYGSDIIAFYEWIHEGNKRWLDCVKELYSRANLPLPSSPHDKILKQNYQLTKKYIRDITEDALEYLYDRGITDESLDKWWIGYDYREDRIVFPLLDSNKSVIGFNKRLVTPQTKGLNRKYIHSPDSEIFTKSQYFYGMDYLDKSKDYIILTEGVFDVILPQQYGVSNTICALGTSLSDYQINVLAKLNKKVIVAYDSDEKGLKTLAKVMPRLKEAGISAKLFLLPEGKDLADLSLELKDNLLNYIFKNCMTYSWYLIKEESIIYQKELYEFLSNKTQIFLQLINSADKSDQPAMYTYLDSILNQGRSFII